MSVTAFAREVGCSQDEILRLLTENRIKFYQLEGGEPFIPKVEMAKAKDMASREQNMTDKKEEHILQNEKDRVSRAESRARVAAERSEQEAKLEQRKSRLSSKRISR
jgi:hypothetical protein